MMLIKRPGCHEQQRCNGLVWAVAVHSVATNSGAKTPEIDGMTWSYRLQGQRQATL
jgi:hypothetical protein